MSVITILDPQLQNKVTKAYAKLGDISYDLAIGLRRGRDYTERQQRLWDKGIRLRFFLQLIMNYVEFSESAPPVVIRDATILQINQWVRCLDRIGELDKYPIVPTLLTNSGIKPLILTSGATGPQGASGQDGDDANIIVAPKSGEDQIEVEEQIVLGVKNYLLSLNLYVAPTISVAVSGAKVFEIGTLNDFNVVISTSKGRDNITALTLLNPSSLDGDLQALVNLPTLNGGTQPVITTLAVEDIDDTTTFSVEVNDGTQTPADSDEVTFVYPFLYGNSDVTSFDKYTLNKLVVAKQDREFNLNAVDDYFYIGFPSSYGTLSRILDDNGFNVISSFEAVLINVTSSGLDNDWTTEYRFYKTLVKTTINNKNFSIEFA